MKITFQITFHKIAKSICKTGGDKGKLSQLLRTLCNAVELRKQVDTMRQIFLQNVSDETEQELVTEKFKSKVRELQQIQGDSEVRAKLLLGKWAAGRDLATDATLDCETCGKRFANTANLRRHITMQHKKRKAEEPTQTRVTRKRRNLIE